MEDMMKLYAMGGMDMNGGYAAESTLIVNVSNPLIERLAMGAGEDDALIAKQIYNLALLSHRRLGEEEMKAFLRSSYAVLSKLG